MIFGIDFDGTIVTHEYPKVGEPVPFAKIVINTLALRGHKCFLFTMRDGQQLDEAKQFCEEYGISIYDYNRSPTQFCNSPKQYANLYIDDAAVGVPIMEYKGHRVVDWQQVAYALHQMGIIDLADIDYMDSLFEQNGAI